ncbi:MAG: zinc-binding alcohol dehydrogenase family protein [Opitutales bacterium]|jgi:2-desacetyl-2-hydroxyethyl bacteriochlorophyllide A dehydrogenase
MQAVVLAEPGRFELIEQEPPPAPGPEEALVRVHRIGVCGTDLHAFAGRQPFFSYPRILGHELGVEIVEAGTGAGVVVGERCSVEPYINDPDSPASRAGRPNCCENLRVMGVHIDGGMRPLITVPARKLHRSTKLGFDQLALVETLCIGAHGVERAQLRAGEAALVVGAGPIGLGAIQFAQAAGARVAVLDVNAQRLAFVRERLGVTRLVDASAGDAEAQVSAVFEGGLPAVVIDATGNKGSMERCFTLLAHGGRLVFLGLMTGQITFDDPNFHRRELTVLASRNALPGTFADVIGRIERGEIDTGPWITNRMTLTEVPAQFAKVAAQPGLVKAMIAVEG